MQKVLNMQELILNECLDLKLGTGYFAGKEGANRNAS